MVDFLNHLSFSRPLQKMEIFTSIIPRWRVCPYIPSIIKDNMVLCSVRKDILHWFCLKIHILVSTDYSIRTKSFCIFEECKRRLGPGRNLKRWRFSSPLSPYPSADIICVYSGSFGVDVDFKELVHNKQKFFKKRSHFNKNIVLIFFTTHITFKFRKHKIFFKTKNLWKFELAHLSRVKNGVVKI